jgi:hypothetical protein
VNDNMNELRKEGMNERIKFKKQKERTNESE